MEKGIFNYDNANVLKLDTNQLNENIKVIDDIFKNYEQIELTIEVENGNTKLKLNGYFIESSPDSCVKCYTMFLPFLLIKIDVFS
ncbi:Uncharacterised protein [Staphylococcus aureus]|nr:Uncharacterised protein [Staphylococcus aureus]